MLIKLYCVDSRDSMSIVTENMAFSICHIYNLSIADLSVTK